MSTEIHRTFLRDQRLATLRTLEQSTGGTANEGVIQGSLRIYGHNVTRDQVTSITEWLREQNYVSVQEVGTVRVIHLLERGEEIALGMAFHPEIARPRRRT